jgi:hypothetical protein
MSKSTSTERRGTVDRQAKSSANMTMSLRNISRMGNSMSAMMAKNKEEDSGQDNSPLPLSDVSNSQWEQAEKTLYSDILEVRRAMDLFLNSHIPEAEQILEPKRNETLYHSLGHSFVLFLRSVMTFQQSDIELAIEALKSTIQKADSFRRKGSSWLGTIGSWVKGLTVQDIKTMSRLHRHAVSNIN